MLSDPACRAVTGAHRVGFHTALFCEFSTFLISGPAEAHHTAAYTLQSSKGYPLVNATE